MYLLVSKKRNTYTSQCTSATVCVHHIRHYDNHLKRVFTLTGNGQWMCEWFRTQLDRPRLKQNPHQRNSPVLKMRYNTFPRIQTDPYLLLREGGIHFWSMLDPNRWSSCPSFVNLQFYFFKFLLHLLLIVAVEQIWRSQGGSQCDRPSPEYGCSSIFRRTWHNESPQPRKPLIYQYNLSGFLPVEDWKIYICVMLTSLGNKSSYHLLPLFYLHISVWRSAPTNLHIKYE